MVKHLGLDRVQHSHADIHQVGKYGPDLAVRVENHGQVALTEHGKQTSQTRLEQLSPHAGREQQIRLSTVVVAETASIHAQLDVSPG